MNLNLFKYFVSMGIIPILMCLEINTFLGSGMIFAWNRVRIMVATKLMTLGHAQLEAACTAASGWEKRSTQFELTRV